MAYATTMYINVLCNFLANNEALLKRSICELKKRALLSK